MEDALTFSEITLRFVSHSGEGNGTPLQYSCLGNPMDGGAWWAAVHGVSKSRTRLNDLTFNFHFPLSRIGEGNGNPLQRFCLEIPRDDRAWWAAVYGVAQSRTWLKQFSSSSSSNPLQYSWASLVAQLVKNPTIMWETWIQSLGWEDPFMSGLSVYWCIWGC